MPEPRPLESTPSMTALYFGCWHDVGHGFHRPDGERRYLGEWSLRRDAVEAVWEARKP